MRVDQWADKSVTATAVFNDVNKTLFEVLPNPHFNEGEKKSSLFLTLKPEIWVRCGYNNTNSATGLYD